MKKLENERGRNMTISKITTGDTYKSRDGITYIGLDGQIPKTLDNGGNLKDIEGKLVYVGSVFGGDLGAKAQDKKMAYIAGPYIGLSTSESPLQIPVLESPTDPVYKSEDGTTYIGRDGQIPKAIDSRNFNLDLAGKITVDSVYASQKDKKIYLGRNGNARTEKMIETCERYDPNFWNDKSILFNQESHKE
jgi:hypothetical protein